MGTRKKMVHVHDADFGTYSGYTYKAPERHNRFHAKGLPTYMSKMKQDKELLSYSAHVRRADGTVPTKKKESHLENIALSTGFTQNALPYREMVDNISERVSRDDHKRLLELVNKLPPVEASATQQRTTYEKHGVVSADAGFHLCWSTQCCRGLLDNDPSASSRPREASVHYRISKSLCAPPPVTKYRGPDGEYVERVFTASGASATTSQYDASQLLADADAILGGSTFSGGYGGGGTGHVDGPQDWQWAPGSTVRPSTTNLTGSGSGMSRGGSGGGLYRRMSGTTGNGASRARASTSLGMTTGSSHGNNSGMRERDRMMSSSPRGSPRQASPTPKTRAVSAAMASRAGLGSSSGVRPGFGGLPSRPGTSLATMSLGAGDGLAMPRSRSASIASLGSDSGVVGGALKNAIMARTPHKMPKTNTILKIVKHSTEAFAQRKADREIKRGGARVSKFAPPVQQASPHFAIDVASLRYTATALTPRQYRTSMLQDTMRQVTVIRDDSGVAG